MEIIRRAEIKDLEAILKLYHQLHPNEDTALTEDRKRSYAFILRDQCHQLTVVETEDGIVATAHLILMYNLSRNAKPAAYIENVVVDKNHRKQEIGERLIGELMRYAENEGCYKIFLCTGTINNDALAEKNEDRYRFYRKVGLKDGIKKGFIHYYDETI